MARPRICLQGLDPDLPKQNWHAEQLVTLLKAGYHLYQASSFDDLLRLSLQDAVQMLGAQRGAVILPDELSGRLTVRSAVAANPALEETVRFSRTLAERSLRRGE